MGKLKFRGTKTQGVIEPPPETGLLPFSPPIIPSARHHYLTKDAASYSVGDTVTAQGDHVIHLPDEPVIGGFLRINGINVARDIVVIGGEVQPPKNYDSVTKRLVLSINTVPVGTWYMWARHGFATTATTNGTFTINTSVGTPQYVTDPIDWNASDNAIKSAINSKLQSEGWSSSECFAVENTVAPNSPGGPWNFIPNETFGLGKCSINVAGLFNGLTPFTNADRRPLTGTQPGTNPHITQFNGRFNGFQPQQWTGHFHLEGLKVYSPFTNDAFNVATRHAGSILTIQNCYFETGNRVWHNDWIHPDGMQQLLGPAKMFCHNVTSIAIGAACINQPRNGMGKPTINQQLGALYDWYWRRCDFHAFRRPVGEFEPANVLSNFDEWSEAGEWPTAQCDSGWVMDMDDTCFFEGLDVETGLPETGYDDEDYYNHFVTRVPNYLSFPAGINLRAKPTTLDGASANGYFCDPAVSGSCGVGYVTPGYTGDPLPTVTQRLENNTLVTPYVHP